MKKILLFILLIIISTNQSVGQIIKVEETVDYDKTSLIKLSEAVYLLDSLLRTDEFYTRFMKSSFVGTKNMTNQEIYAYLMSGNSKYDTTSDKTINLYLSEYDNYAGGNELGVTRGKKTSTHRCFILKNDVGCLAGHLLHEYLHVMGFSHRNIRSERPKKRTVPYIVGGIIKEMLSATKCYAVKKNCH